MKKRSVTIHGHNTSITLEDAFWDEIKRIADMREVSINALISEIDDQKAGSNLSSALRLFVLNDLKS